MNRCERKLFSFLIGNMKDMETELRAQSIVLEALASKIVDIHELGEALTLARNSQEMQKLVHDKYRYVGKANAVGSEWTESTSGKNKTGTLMH
jgi:hypothetical protein